MRPFLSIAALAGACVLTACGGGGGDNSPPAATTPPPAPAPGGNTATITIDPGPMVNGTPTARPNIPFVSVTVCTHGTSNCQTIDHIQLDTGSAGLRLVSTTAITALGLTSETASNGGTLAECAQFADGVTWGPVRTADVSIGGESASNIAIQIIGDASLPTIPTACTNVGAPKQTVPSLGANGIIGVGTLAIDCGIACAQQALNLYYGCTSTASCTEVTVPVAQQVPNPVAHFATDNNGTVVQLPTVPANGAATATGTLIFGIGTQGNNGLGSAQVFTTGAGGVFSAVYKGTTLPSSLLDTGSNALFFPDSTIPPCGASTANGFYCPTATTPISVAITGKNGASTTVNLSIDNAATLFTSTHSFAFDNLGGTFSGAMAFDFGLPFFFGRTVYTAIAGASTPGGVGPYVAF